MNYLANYYTQSNIVPISNCIRNRIVNGKDYICDNSVAKNFLDTAGEEPYNTFHPVEKYKNEIKQLKEKNEKLNSQVKKLEEELKKKLNTKDESKPFKVNGGIWKSPDEKFLIGLAVKPLDPKDKNKYKKLAHRPKKREREGTMVSIGYNDRLNQLIGIPNATQRTLNQGYDRDTDMIIGNYGVIFMGSFVKDRLDGSTYLKLDTNNKLYTEMTRMSWPRGKEPYFSYKSKESFTDLPKKNNRLAYVIFFILALVLFLKLKK